MTHIEQELKFEIDPGDIPKLTSHPLLRGAESLMKKRLRSVYFDTENDDLWESGAILRVRHDDNRNVLTIKCGGSASASMQREEVEHDIEGDFPELSAARGTCLEQILEKRWVRDQLAPRFEIAVERSSWTVRFDSTELEVSLDRGNISGAETTTDICEVELELKSGDVTALYQAARELSASIPLRFSLISKGERGYRLVQGILDLPQKAGSIDLRAGMASSVALGTICASCLKQFLLNERLLHDANEIEAVHQARIAIRRLRVAFTFFAPVTHDEKFASLKQELKWIFDLLGEARDLDVFQSDVIEGGSAKETVFGVDELAAEVENRRHIAYEQLIIAVRSTRFRKLLFDLAEWLDIGVWRSEFDDLANDRHVAKIKIFAASQLERRRRKLLRRALHLEKLDDRGRHRVRIAAKKLRYLAEFFVPVFPAHYARRKKFLDCLEGLQTNLGELNDRQAAARFLAHLAEEIPHRRRLGRSAAMLFAAGRIGRSVEVVDRGKLLRRAAKTASELGETKPFWQ